MLTVVRSRNQNGIPRVAEQGDGLVNAAHALVSPGCAYRCLDTHTALAPFPVTKWSGSTGSSGLKRVLNNFDNALKRRLDPSISSPR